MRVPVSLMIMIAVLMQFSCTEKVSSTSQKRTVPKKIKEVVVDEEAAETTSDEIKKKEEIQITAPVAADTEEEEVKSPQYYYDLAAEAHNHGRYAEAIDNFTKCLKLDKNFPQALGFRGISKLKSGDLDGACKDWKKARATGYSASDELIRDYCGE